MLALGLRIIISAFTCPGVAVHETAHQICCRICRIPVYEVVYFQLDKPCGYVTHEPTKSPWKNLLMATGPFFINTILGMLITLPAYVNIFDFGLKVGDLGLLVYLSSLVLYWLGVSILIHAFPSAEAANGLVHSVLKNREVDMLPKIVTAPFIGLIYIGSLNFMFWLDLIYGIGMSMLLPQFFGRLLF